MLLLGTLGWVLGWGMSVANTEAESKVTPFCFLTGITYILPRWYSGKESTCQGRRRKRLNSIPGSERSLGEAMATHSSILAWSIPWTEEPGGLQSTGWQRVGHDWAHSTHNSHSYTKPRVFFSTPTCFLVAWTQESPKPLGQPGKRLLTIFLEEQPHMSTCLSFLLPTINFDDLGNLKTSFVEVVSYPLVFRIIEVTGQSVQVIIDLFKVFFKERKTSDNALEKCLKAHLFKWQTKIVTFSFYFSLKVWLTI